MPAGRGAGRFADDPNGKGGVRIARSTDEVRAAAEAMIGHMLVTKQTGPAGRRCIGSMSRPAATSRANFIFRCWSIARAAGSPDRRSTEGGMEIEEVAAQAPRENPAGRDRSGDRHCRTSTAAVWPSAWGLPASRCGAFTNFVQAMYQAFTALDCSIVEINPLVVTGAGEVVALDAKISFDDNALFRHPELEKLR